ncbi:Protein kinase domain-containing protein, partial [Trichostrongylus colubriformis]
EATSWSLGVLLFILVTGQLPFKNEIQICLGRVKFPSYLSKECCQLIKSCLMTAAGSRASLSTIRQHPWVNKKMPVYTETFEAVLDRTLGRAQAQERSPRTPAEEARGAVEEDRQLNDVILTMEEITAVAAEKPSTPQSVRSDAISNCTMMTAMLILLPQICFFILKNLQF